MVYSPKVGPKGPALVRFHVIKKINNKKKRCKNRVCHTTLNFVSCVTGLFFVLHVFHNKLVSKLLLSQSSLLV